MKNFMKNKLAFVVATLAMVAVVSGTLPAFSAFAADSEAKVFTATAEITATYDKDGNISVPDVELTNDADFAVELKSANITSDYAFVSSWTNDAAGKIIEPGQKVTIKWTAASKIPADWTCGEKINVGTITYTYERASLSGSVSIVNNNDGTLTANAEGLPSSVKPHYVWYDQDDNELGVGDTYTVTYDQDTNTQNGRSLLRAQGDAGKTITVKVTDENEIYASEIVSSNSIEALDFSGVGIEDSNIVYDGTAKTPAIEGLNGLTVDVDYKVAYENNTDAGSATATITGIGRYAGIATIEFNIAQAPISGATIETETLTYDGTEQAAVIKSVTLSDGTVLKESDYTVASGNKATAAGTYDTLTVKGTGNYTGTATGSFTIDPQSVDVTNIKVADGTYTYTGSEQKPSIEGIPTGLTSGTDYDVVYSDNVNAGTATATVTFKGNYTGSKELTFTIAPKTVSITWSPEGAAEYTYTGLAQTPTATVSGVVSGESLTATLSYKQGNTSLSGAPSAIGNYTATVSSLVAGDDKTSTANYALPTSGLSKEFTITKVEVSGYWLAPAGAADPTTCGIKTGAQIAIDMAVLHGTIDKTADGKSKAEVTAEYTNYMNGKSADGTTNQQVRLYTKWNSSDAGTGKDQWVEFRIIQVGEHDGDGSAVTFMATHSLPTAKQMNSNNLNAGGWGSSTMRTDVFANYVTNGLSDLSSAAITVTKKAVAGQYGSWDASGTTTDKFWLLSYSELYGEAGYVTEGWFKSEGTQYDWCKANVTNPKDNNGSIDSMNLKRSGIQPSGVDDEIWWLRSPNITLNNSFGRVYSRGNPNSSYPNCSYGVVPAFCM